MIYIIILNYKTWKDTIECIESVLKLSYKNYKIVIVDNNSQNNSLESISEWLNGKKNFNLEEYSKLKDYIFPIENKPISFSSIKQKEIIKLKQLQTKKITLIQSHENNGFAAGNNIGIHFAKMNNDFKHLWLLNNDTVIQPNTLGELVKTYSKYSIEKSIGVLGSKLYYYDYPKEIQGLGAKFNKFTASVRTITSIDNNLNSMELLKVDYAIGASIFVSKDFIKNVGLMNEEYFLYYEELDWSIRSKKHGYNTYTCTSSIIYHKQGKTTGTGKNHKNKNLFIEQFKYINLIKIYKNYFPSLILIPKSILLLKALKKSLAGNKEESKMILDVFLGKKRDNQ